MQPSTNADSESSRESILKDRSRDANPGKNNDVSKKGPSTSEKPYRLPNEVATGHPTNLEAVEFSQ